MERKIYYSSKDYIANYNSDFLEWNKIITEGEEKHFLNYQLQFYKGIKNIIENQISITRNFPSDDDSERLFSENIYFRYILKHQSLKDFIKYNSQNELLIILFKKFYSVQREEIKFDENGFGNFRHAVIKILDYINEKLNHFLAIKKANIKDEATPLQHKNTLTTAQQVLLFHYLFKHLDIQGIDKTQQARFIQSLLGKELNAKSIANTNIYSKLKDPFRSNDITLRNDLITVKNLFDLLQLNDISEKISKKIELITKI